MKDQYYNQIPGWLSDNEANELYNLSFDLNGKILEIGTLYGKSTSCICESIRDSNLKSTFNSCDINFKDKNDFLSFYQPIHGQNTTVPSLLEEISFSQNKTIYEVTTEYLQKFNLLKFVNLIPKSFHNFEEKYNFIFCDALHDINEVNINLPHLLRLSENICIWAIHDINNVMNFIPYEVDGKKITFFKKVDNLGIYQITL